MLCRVAAAVLLVASAFAGTVSHPIQVPPIHNYDSVVVQVPGFDESLGHLDSITYTTTVSASGTLAFENVTAWDISAPIDLAMVVEGLGNVTIYNQVNVALSAFDGTLDYAGTSGTSLSFAGTDTWTTPIQAGLTAGVFGQPTVDLTLSGIPTIFLVPNEVWATLQPDVWANVSGTITYTYSDYPFEFCASNAFALCPCGGQQGVAACPNSATPYGARLLGFGSNSITSGGMTFSAYTALPGTMGILFEGTQAVSPVTFGDGVRCVGGSVHRLGISQTIANGFAYPPNVHGSAVGFRAYQYWYRNAANFCTPATFNLSSAESVVWMP